MSGKDIKFETVTRIREKSDKEYFCAGFTLLPTVEYIYDEERGECYRVDEGGNKVYDFLKYKANK